MERIEMTKSWVKKHTLQYTGATRHPFVLAIRDGSVDFTSFKRWLVISFYLLLTNQYYFLLLISNLRLQLGIFCLTR